MKIPNEVITKVVDAHIKVVNDLLPFLYGKEHLHVTILTLTDRISDMWETRHHGPLGQPNTTDYKRDYAAVANSKAMTCARHEMDTGELLKNPAAMQDGDCFWAGGVYYPGLIVACSGAPANVDEQIARSIATTLIAWLEVQVKNQQTSGLESGEFTLQEED